MNEVMSSGASSGEGHDQEEKLPLGPLGEPAQSAEQVPEQMPEQVKEQTSATIEGAGELAPVASDEQSDAQYVIDGVAVAPTETSPPADDSSSVSFNLQTTAGLAVQIHTKMPTSNVVIELQSKLEFALFKLNECEQRLDAAMRTIGSLEARLESKNEELHKLSSELSALGCCSV